MIKSRFLRKRPAFTHLPFPIIVLLKPAKFWSYFCQGLPEPWGSAVWTSPFWPPGDVVAQKLTGDRRTWGQPSSDRLFKAPAPGPRRLIVSFQRENLLSGGYCT